MGKEISDELIKEWQLLMYGFKKIADKVPSWDVKVKKDMHVIINNDWDIICHFINREYIEVKLSLKGDEIMTLRHLGKKSTTVSIVLEYINLF